MVHPRSRLYGWADLRRAGYYQYLTWVNLLGIKDFVRDYYIEQMFGCQEGGEDNETWGDAYGT